MDGHSDAGPSTWQSQPPVSNDDGEFIPRRGRGRGRGRGTGTGQRGRGSRGRGGRTSTRLSTRASASFNAPTKLKISFKAGGGGNETAGGRFSSFLGEYDRELDEHPDEPLAFEEQWILRVPHHIADGKNGEMGLRDMVRGKGKGLEGVEFKFLDPRRAAFKINGVTYASKLVDLPNIIEAQKTHDGQHLFKVADISQMLVVGNPVQDEAGITASALNVDDYIWPHGLTPPLRHARKRRFRKRLSRRTIEVVEEQVEELLSKDEDAQETAFDLIDVHPDPNVPDSYYVDWSADEPYRGLPGYGGEGSEYGSEMYDDPGSTAAGQWEDYGEEGEYEEGGEEGEYDDDNDMDEDLQAALMEKLDRSDSSGEDDGLSGTDDDDDDDAGEDEEGGESSERKAKIKQYTSEIKQLETFLEKKRAGFQGGNPIITKRFEETIKDLQNDINTKVAARQVLLDAIQKEQSDARAAAEAEEVKTTEPAKADVEGEGDGDADALFEDDDMEPGSATPATPAIGVTPAAESDDDDLFGDGDDDDDLETPMETPAPPGMTGDGELDAQGDLDLVEEGEEGDGDLLEPDDEMDEMAALLQAELDGPQVADADTGAAADAATAALDEFTLADQGFGGFGVEGGVGMRRLASGIVPDDEDTEEDSDDD